MDSFVSHWKIPQRKGVTFTNFSPEYFEKQKQAKEDASNQEDKRTSNRKKRKSISGDVTSTPSPTTANNVKNQNEEPLFGKQYISSLDTQTQKYLQRKRHTDIPLVASHFVQIVDNTYTSKTAFPNYQAPERRGSIDDLIFHFSNQMKPTSHHELPPVYVSEETHQQTVVLPPISTLKQEENMEQLSKRRRSAPMIFSENNLLLQDKKESNSTMEEFFQKYSIPEKKDFELAPIREQQTELISHLQQYKFGSK